LAEDHQGLHMGETFTASFENQLMRSIHTDRLFYLSAEANFTAAELKDIQNTKLSTLILRNFPEIPSVQCSAFYVSAVKDCGVQANDTCNDNKGTVGSLSLFEGLVQVSYELINDSVSVTVMANTTGWVAFGFAKEAGRMVGSDIAYTWGALNTVVDATATAKQTCDSGAGVCSDVALGGTADLTETSVYVSGGVTTMKFTRKLVTNDALDIPLAVNTDIPVVVAYGVNAGPLYYHGQNKVAASIRILDNTVPVVTSTTGQAEQTTAAASTGNGVTGATSDASTSSSTTGQAATTGKGDGDMSASAVSVVYSAILSVVVVALYMF